MKPWSIILLILIIADSVFTTYLGTELSILYLWIMKTFNISLKTLMFWRIIYVLPLLWIIDRYYEPKYIFIAYTTIYMIAFISQQIIEKMIYG